MNRICPVDVGTIPRQPSEGEGFGVINDFGDFNCDRLFRHIFANLPGKRGDVMNRGRLVFAQLLDFVPFSE